MTMPEVGGTPADRVWDGVTHARDNGYYITVDRLVRWSKAGESTVRERLHLIKRMGYLRHEDNSPYWYPDRPAYAEYNNEELHVLLDPLPVGQTVEGGEPGENA